MRRCGSGRVAGIAQNLRGAEGRCDSVRVFCEAGVDRAFTASQRISSGWWGRVGVEGKDGGCDGKGDLPGREDCGCENQWVLRPQAWVRQLGKSRRTLPRQRSRHKSGGELEGAAGTGGVAGRRHSRGSQIARSSWIFRRCIVAGACKARLVVRERICAMLSSTRAPSGCSASELPSSSSDPLLSLSLN